MVKKHNAYFVIIGAGQAGIHAIESIRRLDTHNSLIVIDKDPDGFYFRAAMKFHLKGKINTNQLQGRPANFFKMNKVEFLNHTVMDLNPVQREIILENNELVEYERLIICAGGIPSIPPITGYQLQGVHPMRSLQDTREILSIAANGSYKKCCILGTGVLGTELAECLQSLGIQVEMFSKDTYLVPKMLDQKTSQIVDQLFQRHKIHIHYQEGIKEIIDNGSGHVGAIISETGQKIECDGVFICTGIKRTMEFLQKARLEFDHGLKTNEFLCTNDPNIYAAGDVVEFLDKDSQQYKLIELWGPAGDMGAVAGYNAVDDKYKKTIGLTLKKPYLLSTIHAYTTFYKHACHAIGLFNPPNPNSFQIFIKDEPGSILHKYLKLVFNGRQLVGALLLGEVKDPILLKHIIADRKMLPESISPTDLLADDFDYDLILYA